MKNHDILCMIHDVYFYLEIAQDIFNKNKNDFQQKTLCNYSPSNI